MQADTLALTLAKALGFIGATVFLGTCVVPRFMARVEHLRSARTVLADRRGPGLGTAPAARCSASRLRSGPSWAG